MEAAGLALVLSLALAGCAAQSPQTSAIAAPATPSALTLTDCNTQVIDTGQKGSATTNARGLYSDTKIIPGTSNPAVAFVDQSNAVLKLLYSSGAQNVTEVVAGDGAGTFVRLAFLSSGVPIVLWAQGANLKAAIRSAALGSDGTWSAGVIDTGTAPRAIEVAVNPIDQVAVSFLTDTAVGGRAKFLYCDAPCTSPSGFKNMTPNAYVENTAIVAAQTSTGVAWCQNSATSYYPAVVYTVTGNVRYAVCQNTLANCLANTNWTTQTVVAAGNVGSKLLIDPTVAGDVPKVATKGAGGITLYKMGSTACTAAPAAFSAGSTVGTASSGTLWMQFLKDAAGKFHIAANEVATSVRYYNSSTTDSNGAWAAAGTIETVALAAAHGGGAALDTANNGMYVSYGINAAAYDLRLARISDTTVASNLATYSRSNPDLTGALQLTAAGGALRNVATATTSGGRLGVAYLDFSNGAATAAKLKFAFRSGASSTSEWEWVLIPGTINPQHPSLAFDSDNKPWIGYYDTGTTRFYLTTNSSQDGSGSWSTYEFPASPSGAPAATPAANNTAIAMYANGSVSNPVMIVIDANTTSKGVKAAVLNRSTRNWSAVTTIDGLTGGAQGAAHLSADNDSSGNIVIAYQDHTTARVKYAHNTSETAWSTPTTISSINQGVGASIKLNPVTGLPAISYFDQTNNLVLYATCSGTLTTCETGGWTPSNVETAVGVSGLTLATGQLLTTSLLIGPAGEANIFYPHGQANDGNLAVSTDRSGSFVKTTHALGSNGALTGTAALNFAVAGWGVSAQKNAAGGVTSVYVGSGNWLYSTSCGD